MFTRFKLGSVVLAVAALLFGPLSAAKADPDQTLLLDDLWAAEQAAYHATQWEPGNPYAQQAYVHAYNAYIYQALHQPQMAKQHAALAEIYASCGYLTCKSVIARDYCYQAEVFMAAYATAWGY